MKKIIVKILYLLILIIFLSCRSSSFEKFSKGSLEYRSLSLNLKQKDILEILGKPNRKMNIMGWGYYHYDNIGIFFNDIVGYYEADTFKEILSPELGINEISLYGNQVIYGIEIGMSDINSVQKKFGKPDTIKNITKQEEGESVFAGNHLMYFKNKYCLMITYNNEKIVTAMRIMLKTKAP